MFGPDSAEARNLHYEERHGARRCERCGAEQGSAEQLSLHLGLQLAARLRYKN